ncbi:hypothetical protein ACH47B_31785 [Rhodococcus sp. NPDC019627]|uniref:hypothetical protein n=1 Tax=unclassified Rhodococcus (in: high G+C Gram-positive bacteria) TaxID=192944 RepID=UPI0033DC712F
MHPAGESFLVNCRPPGLGVEDRDRDVLEQASRFGYLGTAYAGLRKAGVRAGQTVLIDGATGTLCVSTAVNALAMGATLDGTGVASDRRLGRNHHGSAATGAGQTADHHAEAVVEQHGNAHPVVLGV